MLNIVWSWNIISEIQIHQNGTIWIGKPFSIDLNDQKQVPDGQNEVPYTIYRKNNEKNEILFNLNFGGGAFPHDDGTN